VRLSIYGDPAQGLLLQGAVALDGRSRVSTRVTYSDYQTPVSSPRADAPLRTSPLRLSQNPHHVTTTTFIGQTSGGSDWQWDPQGALARGEETGALLREAYKSSGVPRAPTVECASALWSPRQSPNALRS
jgi:hypothetical protein